MDLANQIEKAIQASSLSLRLFLGLLGCSLLGCTSLEEYINNGFKVGPNYRRPPVPVAKQWIDQQSPQVVSKRPDLRHWWSVFDDPKLDELIEVAYAQNLDLKTAGARILTARALRNIAAGNLFPQFQEGFGSYSHIGVSKNIANAPPTRYFDNWATGFNLSWEIDFWGRFRRLVELNNGRLEATVEDYDDALVILISDVAANYIQIRTFQQRIKYAEENIAIQRTLLKKAIARRAGFGKLDEAQMRSNLTNTIALKEDLEIGLRLANNRLCVLLGIPPRDLIEDKLGIGPIPVAPAEVLVGIPADLIRRRPDVRSAERGAAAQSAAIGFATAALYPRIAINGTIGFNAEDFGELFSSTSLFGDIGPSFNWDILNYGRLLNGIRLQDSLFQRAVLNYQNTVLKAAREVEDGLVSYLRSRRQANQLKISASEAAVAVDIVQDQIKLLKFDVNRAFVTSNFLTTQQDQLAVARGNVALALVEVYKALGGGWEIRLRDLQPPSPPVEEGPVGLGLPVEQLPPPRTIPPAALGSPEVNK